MRSRIPFSLLVLVLGLPAHAQSATFSFSLQNTNGTWKCSGKVSPAGDPLNVSLNIASPAPADERVKLTVRIDLQEGKPLTGTLTRVQGTSESLWQFKPETNAKTANVVTISGKVDDKDIDACSVSPEATTTPPEKPRDDVSLTSDDMNASEWLGQHSGQLNEIRAQVALENPHWALERIVLLPHLPSGAKAPSYPISISERDLAQVLMVVPVNVLEDGTVVWPAIDWSLTRCESIPLYRVYGDIAGLAGGQSKVRPKVEYRLIRIGHTMSCGADALAYSLTVKRAEASNASTVTTTLPVRPVYHLGATAMFGFDRSRTSTFQVRDGKIDEAPDFVGSGLLVGATYFIKGVDFGDMRWYQHVANPFLLVSLEHPTDRFVVGTALTYRGGISLGVGIGFNHVPALASAFTVGQAFSGPGDIPQDKQWTKGFYIGAGVDNNLLSSFRKLNKGGTGGGSVEGTQKALDAKKAAEGKSAAPEKK